MKFDTTSRKDRDTQWISVFRHEGRESVFKTPIPHNLFVSLPKNVLQESFYTSPNVHIFGAQRTIDESFHLKLAADYFSFSVPKKKMFNRIHFQHRCDSRGGKNR